MGAKKGYQDNTMDILNQQLTNISAENQFLTFIIAGEEYGVDVLSVQEIIRYKKPTIIPNTPESVKGVINFRGEVVPVIDLRKKFGFKDKEYNMFTVIIIIEVLNKIVGVIVDEVSDILSFSEEDIQGSLDFSSEIDTDFISGMAKVNDRLIILIKLARLFSFSEYKALKKIDDLDNLREGEGFAKDEVVKEDD
ncbi:chemotaxis protein CheW [Iocasia frigidifontis]|uniref:Chemotaxis protein CheW n=1 Tax=Iocasia fonsfrigidae TaxID=2682810 RepID=A0A8A7KIA4_9FIRM|nr:chemotaxis protein CheW [Iocasia fonsfrigidae]QTL99528.1 chemotaxis protein CheW [Iocasia fonsfrigidae]